MSLRTRTTPTMRRSVLSATTGSVLKPCSRKVDAATSALKDQELRRESLFRQSVEAERNKAELLNKKFEDAMKKAKDSPIERPLRDFDLD